MKDFLQSLADEPIRSAERANKIWLPQGRTPAAQLTDEERAANQANASARRAQETLSRSNKKAQLLSYYAGTSLPAETVAAHVGISVEEAIKSLAALRQGKA